ncbi:MAG: DUF7601 domain-containing protein [Lachnospiraceae bacterium]
MKMKNYSRLRRRITAAMLAMILCLATSVTAFAGTGGTYGAEEEAEFTKILQYADGLGLTTPTASFTFTFTAISKDSDTSATTTGSMPTINPVTLNFSSSDTGSVSGGMYQISKTSGNVLSGLSWTTLGAGVYEYQVTESSTTYSPGTGEAINSSVAVYTLYVVVEYDSANSAYIVTQTYSDQTTSNTGGSGSGKGGANTTDGDYNFKFINTYTKQGGTPAGTEALTISKTTTGTGSDPTKKFSYSITADDSVTGVAAATYGGIIYNSSNTQIGTVSLTADGTAATFDLADGDYVVFNTLPVGTTFTVVESGAAGYIPKYSGTTGASTSISDTGTRGNSLSTGSQTIGSINNVVNYTNTYDSSIIPTGVLSNIAPVAVLITIAILAFVIFAATNRRKASR